MCGGGANKASVLRLLRMVMRRVMGQMPSSRMRMMMAPMTLMVFFRESPKGYIGAPWCMIKKIERPAGGSGGGGGVVCVGGRSC